MVPMEALWYAGIMAPYIVSSVIICLPNHLDLVDLAQSNSIPFNINRSSIEESGSI